MTLDTSIFGGKKRWVSAGFLPTPIDSAREHRCQVWSHNASASLTPPLSGWKIPWDGTVRNTLSVANKVGCRQSSTLENDRSYSFGATPGTGIPLNHPFLFGFSVLKHPAIGVPPIYGTPIFVATHTLPGF